MLKQLQRFQAITNSAVYAQRCTFYPQHSYSLIVSQKLTSYQEKHVSLNAKTLCSFGKANKELSWGERRRKNYKRSLRPDLFKLSSKMRPPDLRDKKLTFPINIPIKYYYVYRPIARKQRFGRPTTTLINFNLMTGNQILLNLEEPKNLRSIELCNALIELSKRQAPEGIDWNQHEWIQKVVELLTTKLHSYNPHEVSYIAVACDRLDLNDEKLWTTIRICVNKTMHRYAAKGFGLMFVAFHRKKRGTDEFLQKLVSRLPIFLKNMPPLLITRCFQLTVDNGLLNDHLFDIHFHVLFWRNTNKFGPECFPTIIRTLIKIKHENDPEFWQDSFLPAIKKMKLQLTQENTEELLDAVRELEQLKSVKAEEYVQFLEQHLLYCKTKLKALENARFYNIVLNDLQYYLEKEKLKAQAQAEAAAAAAVAQ